MRSQGTYKIHKPPLMRIPQGSVSARVLSKVIARARQFLFYFSGLVVVVGREEFILREKWTMVITAAEGILQRVLEWKLANAVAKCRAPWWQFEFTQSQWKCQTREPDQREQGTQLIGWFSRPWRSPEHVEAEKGLWFEPLSLLKSQTWWTVLVLCQEVVLQKKGKRDWVVWASLELGVNHKHL